MNYILVSSTAAQNGHQVNGFIGPTYIDYCAKNHDNTSLQERLQSNLMAEGTVSLLSTLYNPVLGVLYNYTVNRHPLTVLEFLKEHGYKVVGANTIGNTYLWTLQTGTTDQSTQTNAAI